MVPGRLKWLSLISSANSHTSLFPLLRRPIAPSISHLRRSYSNRPPSNSPARRASRRLRDSQKPVLDESKFQAIVDRIPPRFTNEELFNVLTMEEDPLICLELFNWASHQPRFKHDSSTYHATIKKLGVAKMYEEMDEIISQVLAVPAIGNEALFNTIVYFLAEARKLTRAVKVFQHMRKSRNSDSRPSIRTYNILFTAMLSRGKNSYVNHMYMDTISSLFKLMVNDGIDPDIYSLNSMIKGYVMSLHVNEALRVFHQMGVVYRCLPNSFSYDYLIHGLCSQGRTINARELCDEMGGKGFVPSNKSYNSLVSALALNGEVDEAVDYLREMSKNHRSADFITFRTVLDEICRRRRVEDGMELLKEWADGGLVDGLTYRKLLSVLAVCSCNLCLKALMLLRSIQRYVVYKLKVVELRQVKRFRRARIPTQYAVQLNHSSMRRSSKNR
ncbi:Pentatricopeptide repeat-containing protein At2g27800, mitochondrial [Linum perenne]